jgi:hypothetical protein
MNQLNIETRNIQNPALGSILIWRFIVGYNQNNEKAPLPLLFIVLPLIFNEEILKYIQSTQRNSGLRMFVQKFNSSQEQKNDLLFSIQKRTNEYKKLTIESLVIAFSKGLVGLDCTSAVLIPLSIISIKNIFPSSISGMINSAEKLGIWCSNIPLNEISITLKMEF